MKDTASPCPPEKRSGSAPSVCEACHVVASEQPPKRLSLNDRKTIANAVGQRGQWLTTR